MTLRWVIRRMTALFVLGIGAAGVVQEARPFAQAPSAQAGDWPQWRGPNRNGLSAETGLLPQVVTGRHVCVLVRGFTRL